MNIATHQSTFDRIIDSALVLIQQKGFHAFSFRDIAELIGVKAASIHYHFPTKPDLAKAVLHNVREAFEGELERIDRTTMSDIEKLNAFAKIFQDTFADGDRLCPVCMIACAQDGIPEPVRAEATAFWERGEQWLSSVFNHGRANGVFREDVDSKSTARVFISLLEGSMVLARTFNEKSRIENAKMWLIEHVVNPDS